MATFQIKGGHRIDFRDSTVFLTDESDEECIVDCTRDIVALPGGRFDIPVMGGSGLNVTVAGTEEALFVSHLLGLPILAGARHFRAQRVFRRDGDHEKY